MNHFYDICIRPFVEPFSSIYVDVIVKIKISIFYFLVMVIDAFVDLMQAPTVTETTINLVAMPTKYWVGLFILTFADFLFGSIRAATESDIEWNWKVFGRGAYKFLIYAGALIVSATATNMFPLIFGLFQYVIVAVLVAMETHSFFRNTKLLAVWYAAVSMLKRNIKPDTESFMDLVNRTDKELITESQKNKKTMKGDKGEKGEKGEPG